MSGRGFPHLGRDPAPGDVELTRGVVRRVSALGVELGRIVTEVDGAHGGEWQGQAAEAFRATVHDELLPLLRKARDSFDRAGHSLGGWAERLASFQAEAQTLEREAASRQATLDSARRALNYPPSGTDASTLARLDHNVTRATAALAQLEHQADELHDRYLRAARSVAGELERAGQIAPRPDDWLDRLGESIHSWIETLDAPSDLLAGDLWLDLAHAKGEKVAEAVENAGKGLPGLIEGWWSEVSALASEADHGLVAWEDVAVSARRFTALAQAAQFFTRDWAKSSGWIRGATPIVGSVKGVMGVLGVAGDVFTFRDPPDKGALRYVDYGAAGVNIALVGAGLVVEIPGVGEGVIAVTGVWLGGTYAYHHWPWFHDACNTVGHAVATAATTAWHGVTKSVKTVGHVASSALHWITSW